MTAQRAATLQNTEESARPRQSSVDMFESIYDSVARRALELFEGSGRRSGPGELRSDKAVVSSQRAPDSEQAEQTRQPG